MTRRENEILPTERLLRSYKATHDHGFHEEQRILPTISVSASFSAVKSHERLPGTVRRGAEPNTVKSLLSAHNSMRAVKLLYKWVYLQVNKDVTSCLPLGGYALYLFVY